MTPAKEIYQESIKRTAEHFGIPSSLVEEIVYSQEILDPAALRVAEFYRERVSERVGPLITAVLPIVEAGWREKHGRDPHS